MRRTPYALARATRFESVGACAAFAWSKLNPAIRCKARWDIPATRFWCCRATIPTFPISRECSAFPGRLPGYQPDDTPPGGALIFSLWRDPKGQDFVRLRYSAQTVDQMRNADPLTLAAPPASQELSIPGCENKSCLWPAFKSVIEKAIDPVFIGKP